MARLPLANVAAIPLNRRRQPQFEADAGCWFRLGDADDRTKRKTVTLVILLPMPSFGDSNKPVSSVAEVIVASGGAILVKFPQLVAIAGAAKAVVPTNDSANRAKRGDACRTCSPFSRVRPPVHEIKLEALQ